VDDFRFAFEVRVRFAETDAQGIAHHSNYLIWFEAARVAYLAEFAGGYQAIRDQGLESLVLDAHVRFRQPARFDDVLVVHARVGEVKGARFRFDYAVKRGDELLAEGWTSHACVDAQTFRPTRIPAQLIDSIARAEGSSSSSTSRSSSASWSS
jgi:acyl-CoA thioester hydrolase